jgi:hypothetical protein
MQETQHSAVDADQQELNELMGWADHIDEALLVNEWGRFLVPEPASSPSPSPSPPEQPKRGAEKRRALKRGRKSRARRLWSPDMDAILFDSFPAARKCRRS